MGVVTILLHRCGWSCGQLFGTYSLAALRPANAEIRPDCGCRLVGSTPTAYRGFCDVLSGYGFASYRVKFPGVAEITEEHPPKRQQQAAAA